MEQIRKHIVKYIIAAVVLAAAAGLVIRLNDITKTQLVNRTGQTFETGVVVEIIQDNLQEDGTRAGQQTVLVEMTSGEKAGEDLVTTSSSGFLFGAPCTVGMNVVVLQSIAGDTVITSIYSQDRGAMVIGFAAVYILILCLVGGWQGLRGALGLIFTFVAIMYIYLPLVYLGYSPFWVAVLVCGVTALVSLFFIGGLTRKTLCATLGTLAGVICAGVAASIFSNITGVTGWNVSDIESLMTLQQVNGIQVGGLLFSGLLISALGAVMDVSVGVAAAIDEIKRNNPEFTAGQLYRSGIRVGHDMMGTMSNTLILAFAGSSVNTLVIVYAYAMPYLQVISQYAIAIEILRGIAGTLGVILTVPAESAVIAYWLCRKKKK